MGFLVPIVIPAKFLLQSVWRTGIGWEEVIPSIILERWNSWLTSLNNVNKVRVPRCFLPIIPDAKTTELHLFSDASEQAFCFIAYLKTMGNDGKIGIAFVAAKSKVAPQKVLSIPRLELQGAVMSSRLAESIKKELSIPGLILTSPVQ
jgi:hypothetical protein